MTDEFAIFDDMRSVAGLARLGGGILLLGLGGIIALVVAGETYWIAWALAVFMALLGGGLLAQIAPRFTRRRTPFLVIAARGFRCPGLAEPLVPWSSIERILVVDAEAVNTTFFFKPEAALPTRDGSRANVRILKVRHALSIAGPRPRGLTLAEYSARLEAAADQP